MNKLFALLRRKKKIGHSQKKSIIVSVVCLLLLVVCCWWAGKGLFKYSIYSTHDGDHHIARAYDTIDTIREGHFPLRWAGSLNYECGVPIYNFFYPLLYYLVIAINAVTGKIIFSFKLIGFLSLLVGTIFFYLWIRNELGTRAIALASALTYLFAPYRFSLLLVRGSPEYLAYAILPVVLYFYSLSFTWLKNKRLYLFLALATLSGGLLTISHNFTVMFLMPVILLYLAVKILEKGILWTRAGLLFAFSYLSIFGAGAFFIFPALIEKKFTKIGVDSIIQFQQHFPTLGQLIRSKWGYFYSSPGVTDDGMSFMLGYAQWIIIFLAALLIVVFLLRRFFPFLKRALFNINHWFVIYFLLSVGCVFMMLEISLPIWKIVPLIQEIQFPWRLLGLGIFFTSCLFAYFLNAIRDRKIFWPVLIFVALLAMYGNRNHLLPQPVSVEDAYRYSDFERFHYNRYTTTTLGDDVISNDAKKACYYDTPLAIGNDGQKIAHEIVERKNTSGTVKIVFDQDNASYDKVVLGLGYFPGAYSINLNGNDTPSPGSCEGRVCLETNLFQDGLNIVKWKVGQTPIEMFFNYVSVFFLLVWTLVLFYGLRKKDAKLDVKKILGLVCLVAVLGIFAYFRFYNLPGRISFGWDQERDAYAVKEILSGKLTLIGPRVYGPKGFFLPPYFFYLLTPFYGLMHLSPDATGLFIVVYNLIFYISTYLILKKLFGFSTSLIFLLFWAVGPAIVSVDTIAWNPILIPLFVVSMFYFLWRYWERESIKNSFIVGLISGLGASFHVQFLLFLPVLSVFYLRKPFKVQNFFKNTLALISGFALLFTPLLLFDLRHGFLNTKLISGFHPNGILKLFNFLPVWNNFVSGITLLGSSNIVGVIFWLAVLIMIGFNFRKAGLKSFEKLLWVGLGYVWLLFPLFFIIYRARPSEYYFNFLLPIIFVSVARVASRLLEILHKGLVVLVVLGISVLFMSNLSKQIGPSEKSLYYKNNLVGFISSLVKNGQPFNISFNVPLGDDVGFRYLLDYHGVYFDEKGSATLIQLTYPADSQKDKFIVGRYGVRLPEVWIQDSIKAIDQKME